MAIAASGTRTCEPSSMTTRSTTPGRTAFRMPHDGSADDAHGVVARPGPPRRWANLLDAVHLGERVRAELGDRQAFDDPELGVQLDELASNSCRSLRA